jgi:mannitol-1-phosphate 5-dehydrogenase
MDKEKSILIFGAGKIGRSFIGQLFGIAGYEVIFSDIDQNVVSLLNERKAYKVVIKGKQEEIIHVPNVRAISGLDSKAVIREVSNASIIAVSVGKNALEKVIPLIGEGLRLRYEANPEWPLNMIIAENMRSAADFIRQKLQEEMPADYPLDKLVGLVETSIGKMVPIMKQADLDRDPLAVYAEAYNSLIVDRKGFKGEIPQVAGLAPKENIQAWVDRKAFIHNLGHAATAYIGSYYHPNATFIYEVLEDKKVYLLVKETMKQSAEILLRVYPDDFSREDLHAHIEDLLFRFQNKALGDTIFRVGQDRMRKLGGDDRFMGIIRLASSLEMEYDYIAEVIAYAFFFQAKDENGKMAPTDIQFNKFKMDWIAQVLSKVCNMNPEKDNKLIQEVQNEFLNLDGEFKFNI